MLTNQPGLIQTSFLEITSDTSTSSTSYVSLLSLSITTGANPIIIDFTCSVTNSSSSDREMLFRLSVDGGVRRATGVSTTDISFGSSAALVYKTSSLTAGSHTVLIEWLTSASTAYIRPVSTSDEHASLLVMEVTV